MSLELQPDGYWQYGNHKFGGAPDFDFRIEPADVSLLKTQCDWLQTDKDSPFVQVLVVQRFSEVGYDIQLWLTAKTVSPSGLKKQR